MVRIEADVVIAAGMYLSRNYVQQDARLDLAEKRLFGFLTGSKRLVRPCGRIVFLVDCKSQFDMPRLRETM